MVIEKSRIAIEKGEDWLEIIINACKADMISKTEHHRATDL